MMAYEDTFWTFWQIYKDSIEKSFSEELQKITNAHLLNRNINLQEYHLLRENLKCENIDQYLADIKSLMRCRSLSKDMTAAVALWKELKKDV